LRVHWGKGGEKTRQWPGKNTRDYSELFIRPKNLPRGLLRGENEAQAIPRIIGPAAGRSAAILIFESVFRGDRR